MSDPVCCGTASSSAIKPKMNTIAVEAKADDKFQVAVKAAVRLHHAGAGEPVRQKGRGTAACGCRQAG